MGQCSERKEENRRDMYACMDGKKRQRHFKIKIHIKRHQQNVLPLKNNN